MRYLVIDVLRWDVKNVHDLIYILPCPLPYIKKISSFLGKDMLFIWKTLNNDSILIPYHVLYHVPLIFIFVRKMHFSRKVRNWIVWHYWHDILLLLDRLVLLQLVSSLISSEKSRADNLKMRRSTWTLNNDIQTSMYIHSRRSEEPEHSSKSTTRISTKVSILKLLDTCCCAARGPPRNRDSSSVILLSIGVPDPGPDCPVSIPFVPISLVYKNKNWITKTSDFPISFFHFAWFTVGLLFNPFL